MTVILRVGLVVIAVVGIVVLQSQLHVPLSVPCRVTPVWTATAPHGAIWTEETIHWQRPPRGYTALVGWINVATAVPCADEALAPPTVEIRTIKIIETNRRGKEKIVQELRGNDSEHFTGRLFPRVPHWFGETEGHLEIDIRTQHDDSLALDLSRVPLRVYHAWTEPRIPMRRSRSYSIEVEAKISSTARLQLGLDYWRDTHSDYNGWDPACVYSNNCEALVSDWFGDTQGEFIVLRAPLGKRK